MFPNHPSSTDLSLWPIRWFWRIILVSVLFFSLTGLTCFAQPSQPPTPPTGLENLPPGVLPDALYYQNESGEWVRLLIDRVKEFENYLRAQNDPTPSQLPTFRLEDLSLELTLDSKLVRIQGTLAGELEQSAEKWFEIPIAFSNVQVLPTGQSESSRIVPATGSGYVWRHGPTSPGRLTHTFSAVSNITPSTDGGSVRLDLPNSPSRIRFPLAPSDWEITVSGSGGEVVEPKLEDKSYLIRVPGGASIITWTRKAATDNVQATEVSSQLRVGLDGSKNEFTVSCRMTFRGPRRLGGRTFRVQLPSDCSWKSRLSSTALLTGYRLIPILDSPREQTIEIDESVSQSEFEVALEWTGKLPPENTPISIELPRVTDATRHSGNVAISLSRSQSLLWEPQEGILFSRVAAVESADLSTNSFYLQDASLSLKFRIAKEQALPAIRADHRVQLLSDRIFLTTLIEFKEDVRNLPFLQWEGRGWSVVNAVVLSSGKVLTSNQQAKPGDESIVLPIPIADLNDGLDANPTAITGTVDAGLGRRVLVQCVRPIDPAVSSAFGASANPTELELSIPVISWLDEITQLRRVWSPLGLTRFESSVFRLRNLNSDLENLSANPSNSPSNFLLDSVVNDARILPTTRLNVRSAITVMARGNQNLQSWKLTVKPLEPELESNETIRIMAGRGIRGLEQEWLLTAKGGFPESLLLALPNSWTIDKPSAGDAENPAPTSINPTFELAFNGSRLETLEQVSEKDAAYLNFRLPACESEHTWHVVTIPDYLRSQISEETPSLLTLRNVEETVLAEPASFASESIDYKFAVLESGVSKSQIQQQSSVCLVLSEPEKSLLMENTAYSTSSTEIRIGNDIWKQTRLDLPFDSVKLQAYLVSRNSNDPGATRIEKTWVHSIVQNDRVRHRLVFRVLTHEPTVRLTSAVPFPTDIEASVNGVRTPINPVTSTNEEILVATNVDHTSQPNVTNPTGSPHQPSAVATVIELFYWDKISGTFWQELTMPNVRVTGQGDLSSPVLWQVLTPTTTHVLSSSESLSSQNEWNWARFWFTRSDSRDQAEMESWIGASEQSELELPGVQYSISAVDSSQPRWVCLVPVYVVWFPVGCVTILLSALLFHVPWMRSPWVLLAFIVSFLWLGFWWLDGMILLAQVVIMTGVFSVVALLVAWVFDRNTRRRTVLAGRGTTIGSMPSKSNGKSDSKVDSKQEMPANPIDTLPTTISPNADIVRGPVIESDRVIRAEESIKGGSSVKGTVR